MGSLSNDLPANPAGLMSHGDTNILIAPDANRRVTNPPLRWVIRWPPVADSRHSVPSNVEFFEKTIYNLTTSLESDDNLTEPA
jgi:hypothetical protein